MWVTCTTLLTFTYPYLKRHIERLKHCHAASLLTVTALVSHLSINSHLLTEFHLPHLTHLCLVHFCLVLLLCPIVNFLMTIYALYIFDRHCNCIYSREYSQKPNDPGSVNKSNESDMAKLLFGMVYSLKNLSLKLGPEDSFNILRSFSTCHYRIHFSESLSNFKFALISDLSVENLQDALWHLYSNVFVNTVVLNALSPVEFGETYISNTSFTRASDNYLRTLPQFQWLCCFCWNCYLRSLNSQSIRMLIINSWL